MKLEISGFSGIAPIPLFATFLHGACQNEDEISKDLSDWPNYLVILNLIKFDGVGGFFSELIARARDCVANMCQWSSCVSKMLQICRNHGMPPQVGGARHILRTWSEWGEEGEIYKEERFLGVSIE
jgi:hypothetical protein